MTNDFKHALLSLEGELLALPRESLLVVNLDLPTLVLIALGAAPRVREHRAELVRLVGEEMVRCVDRLELVAEAAGHAHVRFLAAPAPPHLTQLSAAVLEMRALLLLDVQSLIQRKLLPPELLAQLHGAKGYKNQYFGLLFLASALRDSWDAIEHATPLELADLDRAEALANELGSAIALRGVLAPHPAIEMRQRAFTLLVSTYDQVRRLVSFLRWSERDVEEIAPSFYAGRRRGRRAPIERAGPEGGAEVAS